MSLRIVTILVLLSAACSGDEAPRPNISPIPSNLGDFKLSSPAFQEGGPVPETYSCEGEDLSPPLEWSGVPDGTAELMLTLLDPDAPGRVFTHWTVFEIEPASGGSAEGTLPDGALEGTNDFGEVGYAGPCPPEGESHRYVFTLAAMAEPSELESGAPPAQVDAILSGAVATTTLTGSYPGEAP
ncbi:MAG: YbhB/YbcL family Raf kinase inhibitor-like protein [Actinomycetota bacterium]